MLGNNSPNKTVKIFTIQTPFRVKSLSWADPLRPVVETGSSVRNFSGAATHPDDIRKGGLKPMALSLQELSVEHLISLHQGETTTASMYLFPFRENAWLQQAETQLHPKEREIYYSYTHESRRRSYLAGRYAAKRAVALYSKESDLSRIWIARGVFGQPVVIYGHNIQVSITHCDDAAAAIAFSERIPLGIDMERVRRDSVPALEDQVTSREKQLLHALSHSDEISLSLLWTVKEALSKVLRTGLTLPFRILELKELEYRNGVYVSTFENFYQYETVSVLFLPYVCSVTYPKGTTVDIETLQKTLTAKN
jgi:phosphopantetheinyl transferase